MRLFFVNRYFYPDHSATSQMLADLAFALAQRGHDITVITSRLDYDNPNIRLARRETIGGVEVIRVLTTGFGRAGLFGRVLDYATFYLAAATALLWRLRRGDAVIAKTDPPMLSVITTPATRLRKAHAINWLQDVYPEVATALGFGGGRVRRLIFAIARRWRDRTLRAAAINVVIGERMAALLAELGVKSERIRVISNWADGRVLRPVPPQHNALRRAWGLEDAFVVGYSGNLGRAHDVETMLAAIDATARAAACATAEPAAFGNGTTLLVAREKTIYWLFVGGGAGFNRLCAEVRRRGCTHVQFRPYQSREALAESLSVPDVHLVSLRPELEGLIVPSKVYGIAAVGRPAIFIGDALGEVAGMLTSTRTGVVVAQGDGDALAAAIWHFAEMPHLADEAGKRARAGFEARYDLEIAVSAWERVIRAL